VIVHPPVSAGEGGVSALIDRVRRAILAGLD